MSEYISPAEKQRMELKNLREKCAKQKMQIGDYQTVNAGLMADNARLIRENENMLKQYGCMADELYKLRKENSQHDAIRN